ncbi:hypothetical protein BDFB_011123, partial [Asbolus verrucosus]
YINSDLHFTRDISSWFINYNKCPSIVATKFFDIPEYVSTQGNFIFLEAATTIGETIEEIQKYPFWKSRNENHFIICTPVVGTEFLPNFLNYLWRNNILNFVVVFVYKQLEVFSYNPFNNNEIINLTNRAYHSDTLFPDKLKNLNGYELKVSIFPTIPMTMKIKEEWYGRDYQQLKMVTSIMNATFSLLEPPAENENFSHKHAYKDIISGKTDFCFVSHFHEMNHFEGVEFTYPHQNNALVILMPITQNIKKRRNLLSIFKVTIWILITVLIATITVALKLANNLHKDLPGAQFLHVWACFLGVSFPYLRRKHPVIKYQLIMLLLMTIVFRTAFHCLLISSFVNRGSVDKITNISDLENVDLKIYTSESFGRIVSKSYGLHKKFVFISRRERNKLIYNVEPDVAFLETLIFAESFLHGLKIQEKNVPYYILPELLVPGFDNYIFQKYSPYLGKVNECLMKELQYGLSNNLFRYKPYVPGNGTDDDNIVLNMLHMHSVFYLLILGHHQLVYQIQLVSITNPSKFVEEDY